MTSTSFNVGLTDKGRLSSRVLRPPGGGHTDIFGGEPEPARGRRPGPPPASTTNTVGQGDVLPPKPMNGAEAPSHNGSEPQEAPQPAPAPAPAPVQAATPAPASTPTEEAKPREIPKSSPVITPTEPKTEAPKRVRVPPGGFSSGLW